MNWFIRLMHEGAIPQLLIAWNHHVCINRDH